MIELRVFCDLLRLKSPFTVGAASRRCHQLGRKRGGRRLLIFAAARDEKAADEVFGKTKMVVAVQVCQGPDGH